MGGRAEGRILRELLANGEKVGIEIHERKLGGGRMLEPAYVYATNHRLIIIRRYVLGFHNSIKIIKYNHITEIKMERGMAYCKIHFSLIGEQAERSEQLKWVDGLKSDDALRLIEYINRIQETPVDIER
jgi:hypothetical protein